MLREIYVTYIASHDFNIMPYDMSSSVIMLVYMQSLRFNSTGMNTYYSDVLSNNFNEYDDLVCILMCVRGDNHSISYDVRPLNNLDVELRKLAVLAAKK